MPTATKVSVPSAYIHEQVLAIALQEPRVRENAPDSIHQMRVAARRLRSVLATYRSVLDRDAARKIRGDLRWLAGALGQARDMEVMREQLRKMVAEEPPELLLGPVSRRVEEDLGNDYRIAHQAAVEALDSERYFTLMSELNAFDAGLTEPAGGKGKTTAQMVRREAKRLQASADTAKSAADQSTRDIALHEVRKDAKRLRYAAEAAVDTHGKRAEKLAGSAHDLQRVLGHHQDSVVTRELLRRLGVEAHLEGDNGFSYGRLHALEQCRGERAQSQFDKAWRKFSSARLLK